MSDCFKLYKRGRVIIQDGGINTQIPVQTSWTHSHKTMEQSVFLLVAFLCLIILNCHLKCQLVQSRLRNEISVPRAKSEEAKKSEYYNWKEELPPSLHLDQYKEHFSTDKNPKNARGKGRTAAIFSAGSWGILTDCKLMHAIQSHNQQSHYTGIRQPYRLPCCMGWTLSKNNLHRDIYNYSNGNPFNRSILQTEVIQISFHSGRLNQCGKKSKNEILDLSQLCHVCLDHLMGTSISDTNFWWKWNGKFAFEQSLYLGDGLQEWSTGSFIIWEMVVKSTFIISMIDFETTRFRLPWWLVFKDLFSLTFNEHFRYKISHSFSIHFEALLFIKMSLNSRLNFFIN